MIDTWKEKMEECAYYLQRESYDEPAEWCMQLLAEYKEKAEANTEMRKTIKALNAALGRVWAERDKEKKRAEVFKEEMEKAEKERESLQCELDAINDERFETVRTVKEDAPASDLVKVIFCKDCGHFAEYTAEYKRESGFDGACGICLMTAFDNCTREGRRYNDYCSRAEAIEPGVKEDAAG